MIVSHNCNIPLSKVQLNINLIALSNEYKTKANISVNHGYTYNRESPNFMLYLNSAETVDEYLSKYYTYGNCYYSHERLHLLLKMIKSYIVDNTVEINKMRAVFTLYTLVSSNPELATVYKEMCVEYANNK